MDDKFKKQLGDFKEISLKLKDFLLEIHNDYGHFGTIGLYELMRITSEGNLNSIKSEASKETLEKVIILQKIIRTFASKKIYPVKEKENGEN